MSRYRVEVDQTVSYQVTVEADTVEEAIAAAESEVSGPCDCPGGIAGHYPVTGNFVTAGDAVELEETPA